MGTFGGSLVKLVLSLVNIFFLVVSLFFFLLGVRMYQQPSETGMLDNGEWNFMCATQITIGVVFFIISIVGLWGTLTDSAFLAAYIYFIIITIVGLSALFGCLFFFKNAVVHSFQEEFSKLMQNYTKQDLVAIHAVQRWQSSFGCCGELKPTDWHNITRMGGLPMNAKKYPASCCGTPLSLMNNRTDDLCSADQLKYIDGCFSDVQVYRYYSHVIVAFVLTCLVMLLLIACSCCLEQERNLANQQLGNLQYAAHLYRCPAGLTGPVEENGHNRGQVRRRSSQPPQNY